MTDDDTDDVHDAVLDLLEPGEWIAANYIISQVRVDPNLTQPPVAQALAELTEDGPLESHFGDFYKLPEDADVGGD